jgi:hypothetical protein
VNVRGRARALDGRRRRLHARGVHALPIGGIVPALRGGAMSIAALLAAIGCGGPTFAGGVYENDHARYRVGPLGPEWDRMEVGSNDLAFQRPDMGTISVNSTCTEYEDVPVVALVNHLLFGTTKRRFVTEEDVTLDGRGARHVIVHAELDGVPLEIELFVMKKDGCVFDLGHVRSRSTPPSARADFLRLVHHFAVLAVHPDG